MSDGIELRTVGAKGYGVFATRSFSAGETVVVGVVERELSGNSRLANQVGPNRFILHGGLFQMVNHSCEPACGLRVNESGAYDLVARRPLEPGEEVTYDYAMDNYSVEYFSGQCSCGESNCRGRVTGWKDLPESRRIEYAGFIAPYLMDYVGPRTQPSASGHLPTSHV
jgi:uncharacterized protein